MFQFLIEAAIEELFARSMSEDTAREMLDDPVYKKNIQELIERNRRFEETKE